MATVNHNSGATSLANGNYSANPAAGDTLQFIAGSASITAGLADQNAVDLDIIDVTAGFEGSLGSDAGSADFQVEGNGGGNGLVKLAGRSNVYLTTTNGIDRIDVKKSGGVFSLTGGTTVDLFVFSGSVTIGGSAVVTNLYVFGGEVVVDDNATAITTVIQTGGTLRTSRDFTTCTANGGNFYADDDTGGTTLNIHGGTSNLRSTGTFATVNHYAGDLTPRGAVQPIDITTLNLYGTNKQGIYYMEEGGASITAGTTNFNGNRSEEKVA